MIYSVFIDILRVCKDNDLEAFLKGKEILNWVLWMDLRIINPLSKLYPYIILTLS